MMGPVERSIAERRVRTRYCRLGESTSALESEFDGKPGDWARCLVANDGAAVPRPGSLCDRCPAEFCQCAESLLDRQTGHLEDFGR